MQLFSSTSTIGCSAGYTRGVEISPRCHHRAHILVISASPCYEEESIRNPNAAPFGSFVLIAPGRENGVARVISLTNSTASEIEGWYPRSAIPDRGPFPCTKPRMQSHTNDSNRADVGASMAKLRGMLGFDLWQFRVLFVLKRARLRAEMTTVRKSVDPWVPVVTRRPTHPPLPEAIAPKLVCDNPA